MHLSPVALDREPLDVLPALAAFPGAAFVHVPDATRPVTLVGLEPSLEFRLHPDGAAWRSDGERCPSDPLDAIGHFVRTAPAPILPFPLTGGVIGYLGYELGHWTVPRIDRRTPEEPLAVLRRYDPLWVYQHAARQWSRLGRNDDRQLAALHHASPVADPATPLSDGPLTPAWTADVYATALARIHDHLLAGDIYQANLTLPYTAPLAHPAWLLCQRLAQRHPVGYVAYLDLGETQIVANSPEMFLRVRDRHIETRPIKGTRPRSLDATTDYALAAELATDEKERAEHIMIVDLERNDLGRICEIGSVHVDTLMQVESHPSIHHLVSSVGGRVQTGATLPDLLRATFPGGSITGAPKQRAMQILAELEPWPRGPYCGAFGVFAPGGDLELGLAIRTAVVRGGRVRWHAGGGIVADSVTTREWDEAWLKTAALRRALAGA